MTIQLDKPREISFTFYALKVFKDETGISILKGGLEANTLDEDLIAALAYAGLKGADRKFNLSVEDVAFHLGLSSMKKLIEQLGHDMTKLTEEEGEKK